MGADDFHKFEYDKKTERVEVRILSDKKSYQAKRTLTFSDIPLKEHSQAQFMDGKSISELVEGYMRGFNNAIPR
jgi:hypothetical protein